MVPYWMCLACFACGAGLAWAALAVAEAVKECPHEWGEVTDDARPVSVTVGGQPVVVPLRLRSRRCRLCQQLDFLVHVRIPEEASRAPVQ